MRGKSSALSSTGILLTYLRQELVSRIAIHDNIAYGRLDALRIVGRAHGEEITEYILRNGLMSECE